MSMFKISSVEGNRQRLDGGAMFGNVPRALWSRWAAPDQRHRIPLACRGFLVQEVATGRNLLLEAGIGAFFEPKLADRFGVDQREHVLLQSLAALGVAPADIDVVVLSHLHFDHAGGLLSAWEEGRDAHELVFPKARFLVGARAWQRARAPHFRDRASFVPELLDLMEASGRLDLVDGPTSRIMGSAFSFTFSDGHTPGMMLTRIGGRGGSVVFCGDLIPGLPWIHLPVTMGYDRFPEKLIEEKEALLRRAIAEQTLLLSTHDPEHAACRVTRDDRGRYGPTGEQAELRGLEI